jgi:hypothetical protein
MSFEHSGKRFGIRSAALAVMIIAVLFAPVSAGRGSQKLISECGAYVIYYQEENERLALKVEELLCGSALEIATEIGLENVDTIRVFIAPDRESFVMLHMNRLPEWGEAFSDLRRNVIGIDAEAVLRAPRPLATVVRHELSHIFFSQRVGGVRCPTWFLEGLAMRQSREWMLVDQWHLVSSIWKKNLPDLEDLTGPFPKPMESASIAYKLSYAAVDRLLGEQPEYLVTLTSFIRDTGDFDRAFLLTFGVSVDDFSQQFHLDLERKYRTAGALMQSTPFWIFIVCLFLLAYIVKRYRSAMKLRAWEEEEQ